MALNRRGWFQKAQGDAWDFLNHGIVNNTQTPIFNLQDNSGSGGGSNSGSRNTDSNLGLGSGGSCPLVAAVSSRQCSDSSQCSSGYRCLNGRCVLPATSPGGSGSSNDSGCGDGSDGGGGGGASCAPSTAGGSCFQLQSGGCSKTGCGNVTIGFGDGGGDPCCGTNKCCRFDDFGVRCGCGPCESDKECNQFCDAYKAANGQSAAGCGDGNECDECSDCNFVGFTGTRNLYQCEPKSASAPCHCENGQSCVDCAECTDTGSCVWNDSLCMTCCNCFKECSCGVRLEGTICTPYGESGPGCPTRCRSLLDCSEACPTPDPNECEVTSTQTICGLDAVCPEGSAEVGDINVGDGRSCKLCETVDDSACENEVEPCDCNCNDDCPDCEICSSQGTCVPDPNCCGCESGGKDLYIVTNGVASSTPILTGVESYSILGESCNESNIREWLFEYTLCNGTTGTTGQFCGSCGDTCPNYSLVVECPE